MIEILDFTKIDIRVGTIIKVKDFSEARRPAYKLTTDLYRKRDLLGRQVLAVVNFAPKRIAGFKSEVLVLGASPEEAGVVLLQLDSEVPDGTRIS